MTSPIHPHQFLFEPPLHLFALELKEELSFHGLSISVGRNTSSFQTNVLSFSKADTSALSRRHARFCIMHNSWHIEDLGSTNGTYLNGQRLPPRIPHALKHGDRIRFANTQTVVFLEKSEFKPKPDKSQNKPPISPAFLENLQKAMDKIYPGLTMYVRDVNLPDAFATRYQPGVFLREKGYVDTSDRVMGMITTHRFAILSNHMTDLSSFEHGTNWGLHIAQKDSRFRVLGTHTYQGKTAIFLLHLPDDNSWKLFQSTEINLDKQLLATSISRFEAKCLLPPVPELTTQVWLDRCAFPIGMDNAGAFFPLE